MSRILLIHWKPADAKTQLEALRTAGHEVTTYSSTAGGGLRELAQPPPDAVVIDLSRLPSHGREVGGSLRRRQATRHLPLVFVGGEPEKVAQTRRLLPDATYTTWPRIRGALRAALARPPRSPVVPGAMDGYSGTPLPIKLGLKPGMTGLLIGAPRQFESKIAPLPEGARIVRRGASARVVLWFVSSRAEFIRSLQSAFDRVAERGRIWVVWPKLSSGVASDLREQFIRDTGLALGWVDFKICAVNETWSGLCFTRRKR